MIKRFIFAGMGLALLLMPLSAGAMQTYSSNAALAPHNSDYINNYTLTANVASAITWPSGAQVANVNCPSPYWTSLQPGATVPAATNTSGTGAALLPAARHKGASETAFYIVSATAQTCSVEFWGN